MRATFLMWLLSAIVVVGDDVIRLCVRCEVSSGSLNFCFCRTEIVDIGVQ